MRDRRDEFDDAEIVVVTFARPRTLAAYRKKFADPLPVVSDVDRDLYRALGFGRASTARVWSPKVLAKYLTLMIRGRRPSRPDADADDAGANDLNQLGGNAVVDADGRLAWVYPGAGPDDRPSVDELLAALRRAR